MKTVYQDTNLSLSNIIENIELGHIALPEIQRPFVWPSKKTRDLFDSMYRGYPIGTLMFWQTGAEMTSRQIGTGDRRKVARHLIVDGQQRLTSLYAVLTGKEVMTKSYETKKIRIAFRPRDENFEVTDAAIDRSPEYISDITHLWQDGYRSLVREFLAKLSRTRETPLTEKDMDILEERIDRVRDLRDFRFQIIELMETAKEDEVAEIFVRINSEGVKLSQADFVLTLMSVHRDEERKALEAFCRSAVDPSHKGPSAKNSFLDPRPDQLLRAAIGLGFKRGRLQAVYNLLRGKDLETGEVSAERSELQFQKLSEAQNLVLNLTNWHEFLKCLNHAGFRSYKMITSENAVIFTYIIWLTGKSDFGMSYDVLRPLISKWFFMAHTTGRYTSSPESQIEADLIKFKEIENTPKSFAETIDSVIEANFTSDYWQISLPNRLDKSTARSPAMFAYWASLNLLDADILFSHLKIRDLLDPVITAPKSIERHHLFPKAHLNKLNIINRREQNAIANMAFVDWPENIKIGATSPEIYWPKFVQRLSEDEVRQQAYWHALPQGWPSMDYQIFLSKRRSLMASVVKDGFARLMSGPPRKNPLTIRELIKSGENNRLELKSSARWNYKRGDKDQLMEHVIAKTVSGFANAEGGLLVIGVDDKANVLGLDVDLKTLTKKPNLDGYELFLREMLETRLSKTTAGFVNIDFENVDGLDICRVKTSPTSEPVFCKSLNGKLGPSEFWVRMGNQTRQLHGDDMVRYQRDNWN